MNDLVSLLTFLVSSKTDYLAWTEKDYMDDEAIKLESVICISIRGSVHFYFDKKGKAVGSNTDSIDSFKKAKK